MRFIILFMLIPIAVFGQLCDKIPESLTEAEDFLANGEIDTTCFDRFRELLLNPVYPRREGWRRIAELSSEPDGTDFPSPAELALLPDSTAKTTILKNHPWLEPFAPLFTFDQLNGYVPIRGVVATSISGTPESGEVDGRIRSAITGERNGSSAELTIRTDGNVAVPVHRTVTGRVKSGVVSIGNMQPPKRSLLWGSFSSSIDETDPLEQILYGGSSTWNGVYGSIRPGIFRVESVIHQRGTENLQAGLFGIQTGKIITETGFSRQVRTDTNYIGSVTLSDSAGTIRVETDFDRNGGVAGSINGTFTTKPVRGTMELWAVNDRYDPEFSSRYAALVRRYKTPGSSVGIISRWHWSGIVIRLETGFAGEICDGGGNSDLSFAIKWPKIWNGSIRQRMMMFQRDSVREQFGETSIHTVPSTGKVQFPLGTDQRFTGEGWNRSVFTAGVRFDGSRFRPDWSFRCTILKDQPINPETRFAAVQKFGNRGTSSLSVTVPFREPETTKVQAQAMILF